MFNLIKKAIRVYRQDGMRTVLKKIINKIKNTAKDRKNNRVFSENPQTAEISGIDKVLHVTERRIEPLHIVEIEREGKRLNLVTDRADTCMAAFAVASVIAVKNNMDLRIITRMSDPNPAAYFLFLKEHNIEKPKAVEFYTDHGKVKNKNLLNLETSENDLFITDSWWSACAVIKTFKSKRLFYIVREAGHMIYTDSDERFLYEEVMNNGNIDFIITSKFLFDYFIDTGAENVVKNGCWFEPAFPSSVYRPGNRSFIKKKKYRLYYCGNPDDKRSLYRTGLRFLDHAVNAGVIDTDVWEVILIGEGFGHFTFSNGLKPEIKKTMSLQEYLAFASTVDLAFGLTYTPGVNHVVLDMAASGSVVLTNDYMNGSMSDYSKNIIVTELDNKSILHGFDKAVKLAQNGTEREANFRNNNISNSWDAVLESVNLFVVEKMGKHV